jgi:hypothetical protein
MSDVQTQQTGSDDQVVKQSQVQSDGVSQGLGWGFGWGAAGLGRRLRF